MRERVVNNKKELIMIAMLFIGSIMIYSGLKVEMINVMNRVTCHSITTSTYDTNGVLEMTRHEEEGIDGRKPFTWDTEEMKDALLETVCGIVIFAVGYLGSTRRIEILKITRKEAK